MSETPSRDDIAALARQAGLDLPQAYFNELASAYRHVREMIESLPHHRPRDDESAHVFVAEKFLPETK